MSAYLETLRSQGVVPVRGIFPKQPLAEMAQAAAACFESPIDPERYRFTPFSQSVLLAALLDYGIDDVTAPLAFFPGGFLDEMELKKEQSWVRKRFAPVNAPRHYRPNGWHQDGGLGVQFPAESGAMPPMTRLVTCWIPLQSCGAESPALEFVRRPLDCLLHYTELTDSNLRSRFAPEDFWAPALELGDGLIFLNGTLHRTYVTPEMRHDRFSVEYRFFPVSNEQ